MSITRNNYEVWFIDYYDGNLSQKEVEELLLFLDKHTDLKTEFDQFSNVELENVEVSFNDKQILKKGNNDIREFSNSKLIALMEGDLDEKQSQSLEINIENDSNLNKEYQLYQLTKLQPDLTSKFEGKKSLKQPLPLIPSDLNTTKWVIRIAAIFLILLVGTAVIFMSTKDVIPERQTGERGGNSNMNNILPNEGAANSTQEIEMASAIESGQEGSDTNNATVITQPEKEVLYTENKNRKSPDIKSDHVEKKELKVEESDQRIESIPSSTGLLVSNSRMDESLSTEPQIKPVEMQQEEYHGVLGGLKVLAKKEVAKSMELDDDTRFSNELSDDNYKKVKLLDIVGLGLSRASKDKVKLKTREDRNGKVSAHGVSVSSGE